MREPVGVSVVIATYERPTLLARLVEQLAKQTLPPSAYEVVVVDDGSRDAPKLEPAAFPFRLRVLRQKNAGAAAARHAGIQSAEGRVIVITDDDMQVAAGFLAAHLRRHEPGLRVAVLGDIRPDPQIARMPVFERFHAESLQRQAEAREAGRAELHGNHLCTGNVSFAREDYFAVGGFDLSLERSEDADLGLRLEQAGVSLVFDREAFVVHSSDHTSVSKWLARAYHYGLYEQRISEKYPDLSWANPWRYLFTLAAPKRPFLALVLAAPALAGPLAWTLIQAAALSGALGIEKPALRAAGLAFSVQYFCGLRREAGSLGEALRRAWEFRRRQTAGGLPREPDRLSDG